MGGPVLFLTQQAQSLQFGNIEKTKQNIKMQR